MARGRRAAGTATAAKKTTKGLPTVMSSSIAAALRQAPASVDADAAFRRSTAMTDKLSRHSQQQVAAMHLQPTAPDISFWKGFCRPALLAQALANIGTLIEADSKLLFASPRLRYPFSALSLDRLQTAVQAIIEAGAFLQSTDNNSLAEGDDRSPCGVDSWRQEIIRKLIELAEAAVPMKWSIISSFSSSGDTFLVTPWALRHRMRRLRRLWELWECHMHTMPLLRLCKRKSEVAVVIFCPSTDTVDTIDSMGGMSSWHSREQHVIRGLMEQANDNGLCSESWGPSFTPPLRIAGGSYILHRSSRSAVLSRLLDTAEFFGLPPFLRSIRIAGGKPRLCVMNSHPASHAADCLTQSPEEPRPSLFPSPCELDPLRYEPPGAGHVQVVQEELIDLVSQHCCFGMLIGEADQVLRLLRASAVHSQHVQARRAKEQKLTMTSEGMTIEAKATNLNQPGASVPSATRDGSPNDPLLPYAQSLLEPGQDGKKKSAEVHWLCGNRWGSMMIYYALVFAVVLPHNCSDGEHSETNGELEHAAVSYYVAAVLELVRS